MVHFRFKQCCALRMTNLSFFLLPNLIDVVPTSNIWNIWRLARHIRKFAKLLRIIFLSETLNFHLEYILKHRPHRPNCPSEEYI